MTDNCANCGDDTELTYDLEEWLTEVPSNCTQCGELSCADCIIVCRTCANEGTVVQYCHKCAGSKYTLVCDEHKWLVCPTCLAKDPDNSISEHCGACFANYNYARKMGGFCLK